jgi:hypothetical protein
MNTEERIKELEARFQRELAELKKELNPELEVGKWYKDRKWLVFVTSLTGDKGIKCYGFEGDWWYDNTDRIGICGYVSDEWKLATEQEVFEALKKEAIKYPKGCKIKPTNGLFDGNNSSYNGDELYWDGQDLYFENKTGYCVSLFRDGKWAEIIKEEPIMIGGFEVKKHDICDSFRIGCKNVYRSEISHIKNIMESHQFKTVAFDGTEVTLETINKIINL